MNKEVSIAVNKKMDMELKIELNKELNVEVSKKMNNEGNKEITNKYYKASVTIEAALILPFITMIFILTIYMGLFLYNKCITSQRTYIETFRGSTIVSAEDQQIMETIRKQIGNFSDTSVLGGTLSVSEIKTEQNEICAILHLKGNNPFYGNQITKGIHSYWSFQCKKEVYRLNHLDFIRNCRRLEKIMEGEHESGK